jgi:hypothetical protein
MKIALRRTLDALFGCNHLQLSRVFTIQKRTYQVCVECGREFEYSWASMHRNQRTVADHDYAPLKPGSEAEASAA